MGHNIAAVFVVVTDHNQVAQCNDKILVPGAMVGDREDCVRYERLRAGGMALGMFENASYTTGTTTLEPGDVLVMYSDGITEAEDPRGEDYGLGRLRELLLSRTWAGARELVDAVMGDVVRFSGGDFRIDDQTVVAVVRRR